MSQHVIVDSVTHRDLRVLDTASAALGDNVMAALATPHEFRALQAYYPIVFRRDLATGQVSALALFGFENGENLFLEGNRWDAPCKPLAHAVQPFLIGRAEGADDLGQVHIDLDHPRVSQANGGGVRLFDEDGRPSPLLENAAQLLGDLDGAYRASGAFFAAIERYDLLEPFTLEVPLVDGSKHTLVGFLAINEDKLRALDGAALAELHRDGHLMPLFMALASVSQFGGLVARRNARISGA
ncbi:MAG: multidrug transporter [Novosphingobium sp. 32-60-15]|uniref:SapC family protein n=1 Tax=unclassified Novosphingobium TaxID=2644732 RepID=UPI000BD872BF|nr:MULTISPECIES: SapC family protein [unclassified Novosphingobium]OYX61896.1 MAG: multidrug transporter [Novosphingobium sp. 32-60-15]